MDEFLGLPFEVQIPNTLFEDELLKFTPAQKKSLLSAGLKVVDIPGPGVLRAREVIIENPHLSIHDGFAFALAESQKGCILLTGDGRLRALAAKSSIDVHGVLWVVEQLFQNGVSAAVCHKALLTLEGDPAVRLPKRDMAAAIKRLSGLL